MHPPTILTFFASLVTAKSFTSPPFALSPYIPITESDNCKGRVIDNNSGVVYCLGTEFLGNCKFKAYTEGKSCIDFTDIVQRPRSIGPDPGGYCMLFKENDCKGEPLQIWEKRVFQTFMCPGVSEMGGKNEWWKSMKCMKNEN